MALLRNIGYIDGQIEEFLSPELGEEMYIPVPRSGGGNPVYQFDEPVYNPDGANTFDVKEPSPVLPVELGPVYNPDDAPTYDVPPPQPVRPIEPIPAKEYAPPAITEVPNVAIVTGEDRKINTGGLFTLAALFFTMLGVSAARDDTTRKYLFVGGLGLLFYTMSKKKPVTDRQLETE